MSSDIHLVTFQYRTLVHLIGFHTYSPHDWEAVYRTLCASSTAWINRKNCLWEDNSTALHCISSSRTFQVGVWVDDDRKLCHRQVTANKAVGSILLEPLQLAPEEGLALVNHTTVSAG